MNIEPFQQVVEEYADWQKDPLTRQIMEQWPDNPYVLRTFSLLQSMALLCDEVANNAPCSELMSITYREWRASPNGINSLVKVLDELVGHERD